MKKIASLTMVVVLLLGMFTFNLSAQENVSVYIEGAKVEFDVQPQIINGRTMVPMRKIFEELDAIVQWFGKTQEIFATKGTINISMTINDSIMYKNGNGIILDVPPCIVDGRTLVPIRAVSSSLGAKVEWDGSKRAVYITSAKALANGS